MLANFVFSPCFVDQYLVTFFVLQRAGYFTSIVILCNMDVNVLCVFLTVPRVGLQCVIVAFLGHTRLLFVLDKTLRSKPLYNYRLVYYVLDATSITIYMHVGHFMHFRLFKIFRN